MLCTAKKSLTSALFRVLSQSTVRKNVHSNCPTRFAPLGSNKTRVRVRQIRLQPLQTCYTVSERFASTKSLTAALFCVLLQPAMMNNVFSNRPTQFAPNSSYTHERVRQSKLQPLQTSLHRQREVRRLQKSLTAALFCKLLQFAAKKKVYRSCPACLALVGNETTHVQLRQSKLQTLQTFMHQQ